MPMVLAPKTRILVAVHKEERVERALSGHDLAVVKTTNQARALLEAEEFGLVILGVHFDESQMFSLLGDIRAHARYRNEGDARIRRIVDYLILLDGELQQIAGEERVVPVRGKLLGEPRRRSSDGAR